MELSYLLFLTTIFAAALAEVVIFKKCKGVPASGCSVTQVRIDPCANPRVCDVIKGTNVTLTFDFTPNFAATKLNTEVYWDNGVSDVPFADMESNDGCAFTQCPTQVGTSQTLNYNMHISKKTPKGSYPIKWKVWNEEDDKQLCCFKANIKIVKSDL